MDYLFTAATILTGFYTLTYAGWLRQNGNNTGAWGVGGLVLLGLAAAVYNLLNS